MSNPLVPQNDPGSYVDLKKRVFQSVQTAQIDDQILGILQKALQEQNVVLSRPERKRLFSQIIRIVLEDLTSKLENDSISV